MSSRRMAVDRAGTDLGPQVSTDAVLTIATAHDLRAHRWRVVIALRPARSIAAGELVTRDLAPDEIAAVIEGLELARDEALALEHADAGPIS